VSFVSSFIGSLCRSERELLPLFKKGTAPHVNNVELGTRGRWRSNIWTYPGASDRLLAPDVGALGRPTRMLVFAVDCTNPLQAEVEAYVQAGIAPATKRAPIAPTLTISRRGAGPFPRPTPRSPPISQSTPAY
jgi:hypothetical protein